MRESKKVFYRLVKKNRTKRIDVLTSRYGRFNYKNETGEEEPMTYLADTIETAWSEISAHFGLIPSNPKAFRLYQAALKDINIVDLTNPDELDKLGISEAELRGDPALPQCQEVAKKLRQAGYDGAIYRGCRYFRTTLLK